MGAAGSLAGNRQYRGFQRFQAMAIQLARYTVRYDSRIKADMTLTDENGNDRTILGVQPLGRKTYLDLLAERIS